MAIDTLIMKSITNELRTQIQKKRTVYEKMRHLQRYYRPTAVEWRQVLNNRINGLATPDPDSDLIEWADQWLSLANDVKEAGLPGVNDITLRDSFLQAASTLDYAFTVTHTHVPESDPEGKIYTLESVLRTWHLLRRAPPNQGTNSLHSAATFNMSRSHAQNTPSDYPNRVPRPPATRPTTRRLNMSENSPRMSPCACGLPHRFADCFYMVEGKRPPNWQPREHIVRRVKSWLREPANRRQVETTFSRQGITSLLLRQVGNPVGRDHNTHAVMMNNSSTPEQPDPFPYGNDLHACWQITTCLSSPHTEEIKDVDPYPLKNSFIFDTGADTHIANNLDSFISPIRPAPDTHRLYSGDTMSEIRGYGEALAHITDTSTGERKKIILKNTAYVPSLHTNIISAYRCKQLGIFADFENLCLYRNTNTGKTPFAQIFEHNRMFVIDYKPLNHPSQTSNAAFQNSHTTSNNKASLETWHRRLGHASQDIIRKLPTAARGVSITNNDEISNCETCHLTKAKHQISRVTPDPANQPFEKVHVDLMFFEKGYNGHTVAMHLYDTYTSFHMILTGATKRIFNTGIMEFLAVIYNQFHQRVRIIGMDNESTFDNDTKRTIQQMGIIVQHTAPATPEQNGSAERAGQTLAIIGRGFRIAAKLPSNLWPELITTGVYIANRTPIRRHNFKTPYELLFDKPPKLHHLHIIGCKAYVCARNGAIPKTHKLQPRASIGYLVGYTASTIFRVWIPHLGKIISSRDVQFDEAELFDPRNPFPDEYAQKLIELQVPQIELDQDTILWSRNMDILDIHTAEDTGSPNHNLQNENTTTTTTPQQTPQSLATHYPTTHTNNVPLQKYTKNHLAQPGLHQTPQELSQDPHKLPHTTIGPLPPQTRPEDATYTPEPRYMTPISLDNHSSPPSDKPLSNHPRLAPVRETPIPTTTTTPPPPPRPYNPLTYVSSPDSNSSIRSTPPRNHPDSPTPNYHQALQTPANAISSPLKRLSLHDNPALQPEPDTTTQTYSPAFSPQYDKIHHQYSPSTINDTSKQLFDNRPYQYQSLHQQLQPKTHNNDPYAMSVDSSSPPRPPSEMNIDTPIKHSPNPMSIDTPPNPPPRKDTQTTPPHHQPMSVDNSPQPLTDTYRTPPPQQQPMSEDNSPYPRQQPRQEPLHPYTNTATSSTSIQTPLRRNLHPTTVSNSSTPTPNAITPSPQNTLNTTYPSTNTFDDNEQIPTNMIPDTTPDESSPLSQPPSYTHTPPDISPIRGPSPPQPQQPEQQEQPRRATTRNTAPRRYEISADLSPSNMLPGRRTRSGRTFSHANFLSASIFHTTVFNAPFVNELPPPPEGFWQVKDHPQAREFRTAETNEWNNLCNIQTFRPIPITSIPPGIKILPLKWTYAYKQDSEGRIDRYKARLCVRGDLEPKNDNDNRALTLAIRVFRAIMAIAAKEDLYVHQIDVINAFVQSHLEPQHPHYEKWDFNRMKMNNAFLRTAQSY